MLAEMEEEAGLEGWLLTVDDMADDKLEELLLAIDDTEDDTENDKLDELLLAIDDMEDDKLEELLVAEVIEDSDELVELLVLVMLELEVEFDVVFKHLMLCQLPLLSLYSYWEHGFVLLILTLLT